MFLQNKTNNIICNTKIINTPLEFKECHSTYSHVMRIIFFYICLFLATFPIGCISSHKGYKIEDDMSINLQRMVSNRATVHEIINKFGSPTFINNPINDTFCYIDANDKKVAFNRFYKPNYQFICVVFEQERAKELKQMSLTKIKKTKMVKYDTSFEKPL